MFQALIDVILPVFLLIGAGYGMTRAGYFNDIHIEGLMKFTQGFAIPCLLFRAISTIDLSTGFDPRLLASFYGSAAACFIIGLIGARLLFKREWEDCVVIGFAALFSNAMLLGLPITDRAYGPDNLVGNYAIIAFHAPFCYALGITTMEFMRHRGKSGRAILAAVVKSVFRNALIVGILLGFWFNLTGWRVPALVDDALEMIVRAALPGALFALGGVLVRYRPEGDLRAIAFVCAISLIVHPVLVYSVGSAVGLPEDLFRSAVLTAAMAPGFNAYIFSNVYGRAKRVAASSVLIATASSAFSVWGWLLILG